MRISLIVLSALFLTTSLSYGQNLLAERIWKVPARKKSIFFDKGVFHSSKNPQKQKLINIRNSFVKSRGYERIVFDFSSSNPPRIYGHIAKGEKKVYLDFFNTQLPKKVSDVKGAKYLKEISFYNIEPDQVSVELEFKQNVSFDIFYLQNPGRLVLDVKK